MCAESNDVTNKKNASMLPPRDVTRARADDSSRSSIMPGAHIHQNTLGDGLVPLINKLQDIFTQAGVDNVGGDLELPQIAVVGSQSSGKSSVLEALVGRDFLPRGPDICTRRPLVLQLVHTPYQHASHHNQAPMEWGEFLHRPGEIFTEFEAIREEIECETNRGIGTNKGVSDKQIRLKICSPHVLTMTLVDLPGITRVPVGDQPADIEKRIRDMILSYIKRESCLILAVSPANTDLANSDALTLSRLVDPDGKRTIGVVTKLDIMDRGTDAVAYLRGEVVPLRLGYIGVVNRCQQDIAQRRSIREARASEAEFFRHHPAYAEVIDKCGTEALGWTVSRILADHIADLLPALSDKIATRRAEAQRELVSLGEGRPEDPSRQSAMVLEKLHGYAACFTKSVVGKSDDLSTSSLEGGARIHFVLQDIFVKGLESLDPTRAMSEEDIRTAIQNAAGTKAVLLLPDDSFEVLVKQAIRKMSDPCVKCARIVHDELGRIARTLINQQNLQRYPRLAQSVEDATRDFLVEGLVPAESMINSLVECQLAHINTSHPDFVGGSQALRMAQQELKRRRGASASAGTGADDDEMSGDENNFGEDVLADVTQRNALQRKRDAKNKAKTALGRKLSGGSSVDASINKVKDKENDVQALYSHENGVVSLKEPPGRIQASEPETDEELLQVLVTRILLGSYFAISRGVLADTVPKAVMHFLVNSVQRGLQQHLIQSLYHPNLVPSLLTEHPETEAKRLAARNKYKALSAAAAAISAMPADLAAAGGGIGGRR
jgi:dynamin 1-like protein